MNRPLFRMCGFALAFTLSLALPLALATAPLAVAGQTVCNLVRRAYYLSQWK